MSGRFSKWMVVAAACLAALLVACCDRAGGPARSARPDGPMRIVVTLPPLEWVARSLAPADATVTALTPPGASEHTYEPPPSAIVGLVNADVVLAVGMGLDRKVEAALDAQPRNWRRVVWFDEVVGLDGAEAHHHHHDEPGHVHDETCAHGDGDADPHLWLDAALMEKLVPAVKDAVASSLRDRGALTPEEQSRLDAAAASLLAEIRAVSAEYDAALRSAPSKLIVTHHNAFGRIADRYGLEVAAVLRPVHVVESTPGDVQAVVAAIREWNVGAIFIEPQYSQEGARRIAEVTGVKVLPMDALGDGDWPKMMRANLQSLVEGLAAGAKAGG